MPVDPNIAVELQKLFDEANVEVSKAKPNLEVVEEESEAPEAPKAVAKPFRVQSSQTGTIITYDDLLRFIPGETWTEIDLKTNCSSASCGGCTSAYKVYRVRYDGGLSVDLNVMPPTGAAENCEDPRWRRKAADCKPVRRPAWERTNRTVSDSLHRSQCARYFTGKRWDDGSRRASDVRSRTRSVGTNECLIQ